MGTYQVSGAVTKILPVSMLTDGKKLEFIPVSYLTRCSPYAEVFALRGLSPKSLTAVSLFPVSAIVILINFSICS